eukprot:jgi/Tetstr1/445614/TSEL_003419.t1
MTTSAAAFKPQACGAMYDAAATDSPGSVSSSHDTPNGALLGGVRPPAASSGLAPRSLETAAFAPRAQEGNRSMFNNLVATVRPGSARLWDRVKSTAGWMEEGLAEFFGLNESKYEWAIIEREYQAKQRAEEAAIVAEREAARREEAAAREMA